MARHHLALLAASLSLVACAPEPPEAPRDAPSRIGGDGEAAVGGRGPSLRTLPAQLHGTTPGERRSIDPRPVPAGHVAVTVVDHGGVPVSGIDVIGFDLDGKGEPPHRILFTFAEETGPDGRAFVPTQRQGELYAARLFDDRPVMSSEDEPTRINLPPCGSLRIDLSGHPDATRVRAGSSRDGRPITHRVRRAATFSLDRVPVGGRLELEAISRLEAVAATISGPSEPGEVVVWRPMSSPTLTVRARLIDDACAPSGRMSAMLGCGDGEIALRAQDRRSGVVAGEILARDWGLAPGEFARVRARDGVRADAVLLEGEVAAPTLDGSPSVDLGDIRMTALTPLLSGRVVDVTGKPVAGACVRLLRRADAHAASTVSAATSRRRVVVGEPTESSLDALQVATDESGRFAIRSQYPVASGSMDRVYIHAAGDRRGGAEARATCEIGQGDLELVLRDPGRVRVGLTAAPESMRRNFGLCLRRTDGLAEPIVVEPWRTGSAVGDSLDVLAPPGRYDIEVRFGHGRAALVEDVHVPSGTDCRDPRLDPLALQLHCATLRCPGGRPLSSHGVGAFSERSGFVLNTPIAVAVDESTGRVEWFEFDHHEHLFVVVGDHLPVDLVGLQDGAIVELDPLERFRIELEGAPTPPDTADFGVAPLLEGWPRQPRGMNRAADGSLWHELARGRSYRLGTRMVEMIRIIEDADPHAGEPELRALFDAVRQWEGVEFTVPVAGDVIVLRPR